MKQKRIYIVCLITVFVLFFLFIYVFSSKQQKKESTDNQTEIVVTTDTEIDPSSVYLNCKSDNLSDHALLEHKENGPCNTLTGDVLVTVIFVESWTEQEMASVKNEFDTGSNLLMQAANEKGIKLNIRNNYINSEYNFKISFQNIHEIAGNILEAVNLPPEETQEYIKNTYSVKEAPIIFVANFIGRSFAVCDEPNEYILIHHDNKNASEDCQTYQHELLHLFGAEDFYFMEDVNKLATDYLPNSIMNGGTMVDDFTAFLIGWNDTPSENVNSFLQKTAAITQGELEIARQEDQITGFETISWDGGTYTGELMQGLPQGQGKIIWEDGSSYEGHWTYGKIDGYGTMTYVTEESDVTWICAVSYSGEWKDGLKHGKGILTFSDGTTLETTWEHGVPIQ